MKNTVDELISGSTHYNSAGGATTGGGGSGKGLDVAAGALQLGSTVLATKANKPEFSQYVKTKCGRKPILAGKKKKRKYNDCKESALRDYASLGQGGGSSTPPPSFDNPNVGGGGTGGGSTGGGMSTKTMLLIGGGVVVVGLVLFFAFKKK